MTLILKCSKGKVESLKCFPDPFIQPDPCALRNTLTFSIWAAFVGGVVDAVPTFIVSRQDHAKPQPDKRRVIKTARTTLLFIIRL